MNKYSVSLVLHVSTNMVSTSDSYDFWKNKFGNENVNIDNPTISANADIRKFFTTYAEDKNGVIDNIGKLCYYYTTEKLGISVEVKSYKIDFARIMETDNGHNKELVEGINYLYSHGNEERLTMIAKTLFERDCEEAEQFGITDIDDLDNEDVLHSFLTNVCDDMDLETILKFCRYDLYKHE